MARCVVSTTLDYVYLEKVELEAEKRGLSVSALVREVIMAAFPSKDVVIGRVEVERDKSLTSEMKLAIYNWWADIPVQERPLHFDLKDVALRVFKTNEISHGTQVRIGRAMRQLGFVKDRLMVAGIRRWAYRPGDSLRRVVRGEGA